MPKYAYKCKNCGDEFEVRHSMRDRLYDCIKCGMQESLVRIPQMVFKQTLEKDKPGQLVKEYIDDNREVLKQQKQEASSEFYEP